LPVLFRQRGITEQCIKLEKLAERLLVLISKQQVSI